MSKLIDKVEISKDDNLLRRFLSPNPPNFIFIKDDGTICSTCFQLRKNEDALSVDLERLTTLEKSIKDKTKYRLLKLNAGEVQKLKLLVEHDPNPKQEPDNISHTLIKGNIDKKISKKLASLSKIIIF